MSARASAQTRSRHDRTFTSASATFPAGESPITTYEETATAVIREHKCLRQVE
jgi:hypothetical protein